MISFVIPCYNSSTTLTGVVEEIKTTMQSIGDKWEVVLINDCSPNNGITWKCINEICQANKNVIGIDLSRNFGQHAAIMAGLQYVTGDVVVCLDDDGQTPANEVGKLLSRLDEGYDVVYAKYETKKHSLFRNFGSYINNRMACWLLDKPKDLYVSSYFAAKRYVVDEIIKYTNPYPYIIGLVLRTTKHICNEEIHHKDRESGVSGYNLIKLLRLWLNGFTSFSVKPLRIATMVGGLIAVVGFMFSIFAIINKFINPLVPMGWSSLVCILMILGGGIMVMLGLLGEYIGRIYISLNNSPQFVTRCIIPQEKESACK